MQDLEHSEDEEGDWMASVEPLTVTQELKSCGDAGLAVGGVLLCKPVQRDPSPIQENSGPDCVWRVREALYKEVYDDLFLDRNLCYQITV